MTDYTDLPARLAAVNEKINTACLSAQRSAEDVTLLAVSKRHASESIRIAYQHGHKDFGENYLNEALEKQQLLSDCDINWHYIGSIQSNKTRKMAENFDWVHTVDSFKIAKRLSQQRPKHMPPINICLQINIDTEDSKSGLLPDTPTLIDVGKAIDALPHVVLRGLMCIPAPKNNANEEMNTFQRMQQVLHQLNHSGLALDTLSMGMSDDLDSAISCGSTIVRVGTAIFGPRT